MWTGHATTRTLHEFDLTGGLCIVDSSSRTLGPDAWFGMTVLYNQANSGRHALAHSRLSMSRLRYQELDAWPGAGRFRSSSARSRTHSAEFDQTWSESQIWLGTDQTLPDFRSTWPNSVMSTLESANLRLSSAQERYLSDPELMDVIISICIAHARHRSYDEYVCTARLSEATLLHGLAQLAPLAEHVCSARASPSAICVIA